jgi:DNA-directed RNA polymerase specialized sigma24 family protein
LWLSHEGKTEKGAYRHGEETMKDDIQLGLVAYDSDPENEFLAEYDSYIQAEARKAFPSRLFPKDMFELEVTELAQIIRIKLWKAYQKRTINNPRAYIRMIAYTSAVDMVRHHQPTISLFTEMNGEPGRCDFELAQNERLRDPAFEIELGEIDRSLLTKLVEAILALPHRQRHAVLYSLKEHHDEVQSLINALKDKGIDIATINWPREKYEVYLLKASLSIARKKLQWLLRELIAV